jgi:hypothetical protein
VRRSGPEDSTAAGPPSLYRRLREAVATHVIARRPGFSRAVAVKARICSNHGGRDPLVQLP